MAKYPSEHYPYSHLSEYYNQLSLQESLNTVGRFPKYFAPEVYHTYDNQFQFNPNHASQNSHYSSGADVCLKPTPSYSKVHPKKKMRMAYDKEMADSTPKNVTAGQSLHFNNAIKPMNFSSSYSERAFEKSKYSDQNNASFYPQTRLDRNVKGSLELPTLIPMYPETFQIPSPLTPRNSSNSSHEFPASPVEDAKQYTTYSEYKWPPGQSPAEIDPYNSDKPQDLRVSFNERLKDVARDILTAPSLPQLNYSEIPELVSLHCQINKDQNFSTKTNKVDKTPTAAGKHGIFDILAEKTPTAAGKHGIFDNLEKRMSGEISSHSPRSHSDISHNNSKCDTNCSTSCFKPYPSSSTQHTSKNVQNSLTEFPPKEKWADKSECSPLHDFDRYDKPQSTSNSPHSPADKVEDPVAYLRKPIGEWSYADVIFFLMDACKELRINPGDVKFKRSDNGSVLLQMLPGDFEVLAPNHGQILYDYFINFQTQHFMSTDARSAQIAHPHRYNGNYDEAHTNYSEHSDQPHPSHHHHHHHPYSPTDSIYPHPYDHRDPHSDPSRHYNAMPRSPYDSPSFATESPSNEYVPQGSQYTDHIPVHSPAESRQRKSYDLPSAAWKTFPPLHNYDEPLSDPDDFEDEPVVEPPKKRGPGRPPKPESERKRRPKKTGRLWEFIRNLLLDPKTCPSLLRWEDAHLGVFRIVQSDAIANKWGMRKNNEKMNYEKLSRAMRYYYKAKIFEPVLGKRLVYKFGSNAKGWRPLNPNNPNFQNF